MTTASLWAFNQEGTGKFIPEWRASWGTANRSSLCRPGSRGSKFQEDPESSKLPKEPILSPEANLRASFRTPIFVGGKQCHANVPEEK